MRYIVTGGNGFVGTNLIKELLVKGHEVISIDNLSIGKKDNEVSGVKYIYEDVNNINDIEGLDNIDGIFHLAGLSRIQPSFDNPPCESIGTDDGPSVAPIARIAKPPRVSHCSGWPHPNTLKRLRPQWSNRRGPKTRPHPSLRCP